MFETPWSSGLGGLVDIDDWKHLEQMLKQKSNTSPEADDEGEVITEDNHLLINTFLLYEVWKICCTRYIFRHCCRVEMLAVRRAFHYCCTGYEKSVVGVSGKGYIPLFCRVSLPFWMIRLPWICPRKTDCGYRFSLDFVRVGFLFPRFFRNFGFFRNFVFFRNFGFF